MDDGKKILAKGDYIIEKFSGKGGWVYVRLPEVPIDKASKFGWIIVSGYVDDLILSRKKLMPFGDGTVFLPLNAKDRSNINKSVGDTVSLHLYRDDTKFEIPVEIKEYFKNEPKICAKNFLALTESKKEYWIRWIYGAKTDRTRISRICTLMDEMTQIG